MKKCIVIIITLACLFIGNNAVSYAEKDDNFCFDIGIPGSIKAPVQNIILGVFKTLVDKHGDKQEKFTIKIHSDIDKLTEGELFFEIASAKKNIFIAPIVYRKNTSLLDKLGFRYKKLGVSPVVVITSKAIKNISDISSELLEKIVTGEIKDWSGISDELSGKLIVYCSNKKLIKDALGVKAGLIAIEKRPQAIINLIDGNEMSIGIIPMSDMVDEDLNQFSMLSIDGNLPVNKDGVVSHKYPYNVAYYLFWDSGVEKSYFFEEFFRGINKESNLRKLCILQEDIILRVPSTLEGSIKDIILKKLDNLGAHLPQKITIVARDGEDMGAKQTSKIMLFNLSIAPLSKKNRLVLEKDRGFNCERLGLVPIGIITSKSLNNITGLTLKSILTGKINNWSQISPDLQGEIIVYCSVNGKKNIPKKLKIQGDLKAVVKNSYSEIIDIVGKEKNSIGIIPLIGITQRELGKINILNIDNISPVDSSDQYAYHIEYYFIFDKHIEHGRFCKELRELFSNKEFTKKYNIRK